MERFRWRRVALCLFVGLAVALGAWAFVIEPSRLVVREHRIDLDGWPAACSGLRVAVLTDLHVGARHFQLDDLHEVVERTAEADVDLVLLAGDYVHEGRRGVTVAPERIADALRALDAPLGAYGVLGNHDLWFDGPRVERALVRSGIDMIDNRSRLVRNADCRLRIRGVGDFRQGEHRLTEAFADGDPNEATLLVTHNPDLFPILPPGVDLAVAGHTHGGQVDLPLLGRRIVPSIYGERYAAGLVVEHGRAHFIGTGLGTSILAVRFRVPPEISILTLESRGRGARGAVVH